MLVLCFKLFLQVIGLLSKDIPIVSYIMGCFWSNEADARERYHYQPRGIKKTHTARQPDTSRIRPLFGEYRCTCRRFWASRLSWPNMYQVCKKCGNHVYAHTQREVRPSDTARDRTGTREHQQDYCQMCQHLGQYCGNIRRMR